MTSEREWLGERDPPWTSEVPTVEGWYWVDGDSYSSPAIVQVVDVGGLCVWYARDGESTPLHLFALWLGPLPVPALPKEVTDG